VRGVLGPNPLYSKPDRQPPHYRPSPFVRPTGVRPINQGRWSTSIALPLPQDRTEVHHRGRKTALPPQPEDSTVAVVLDGKCLPCPSRAWTSSP
jgi:hypothetical protein